jgi:hypothetical protein
MYEYDDRAPRTGTPGAKKLLPATRDQQDAYWLLRSQLTQALVRNWQTICATLPEVAAASDNLDRLVRRQSTRTFKIFRPEDADAEHDHRDAGRFLR